MPKTHEIISRIRTEAAIIAGMILLEPDSRLALGVGAARKRLDDLAWDVERDGIEDFSESLEHASAVATAAENAELRQTVENFRQHIARLCDERDLARAERDQARSQRDNAMGRPGVFAVLDVAPMEFHRHDLRECLGIPDEAAAEILIVLPPRTQTQAQAESVPIPSSEGH